MTSTHLEVLTARKRHRCEWCWEHIAPGQRYVRYRWFDGGDAGTVREHPECYDAMLDADIGSGDTWTPGDNPRGCNCGWDPNCDRCSAGAREANEA